jgi:hypothetical protein
LVLLLPNLDKLFDFPIFWLWEYLKLFLKHVAWCKLDIYVLFLWMVQWSDSLLPGWDKKLILTRLLGVQAPNFFKGQCDICKRVYIVKSFKKERLLKVISAQSKTAQCDISTTESLPNVISLQSNKLPNVISLQSKDCTMWYLYNQ